MGPPTGARAYSRAEVISVFSQADMVNCGASDSGRYHAHLARLLLGGLHANQIVASNFRKLHLKTVRNSGFRLCEDPWCQNGRDKRISAHSGSEVTQRGIIGFNYLVELEGSCIHINFSDLLICRGSERILTLLRRNLFFRTVIRSNYELFISMNSK